jgi:hypothetical protein
MIRFFAVFVCMFFAGCALKKPAFTNTYLITLKTKKFRFSDFSILKRYSDGSVEVKIYNAGVLIQDIKIDSDICSNDGCLSKEKFNEIYLSRFYPPDLLKNVILGKPIFNSKNFIKKNSGFEQKIFRKNSLDIIYIVNNKEIYFKDKINKILIKVKRVEER